MKKPEIFSSNTRIVLFTSMVLVAYLGVTIINKQATPILDKNQQALITANKLKKQTQQKNNENTLLNNPVVNSLLKNEKPDNEATKNNTKPMSSKDMRKKQYVDRLSSVLSKRLSSIKIKRKGSCEVTLNVSKNGRIASYELNNCLGGYSIREEIGTVINKVGVLPAPRNEFYNEVKTVKFRIEGNG